MFVPPVEVNLRPWQTLMKERFSFAKKVMCRTPKCVCLYELYLDLFETNRNMLIYLQLKTSSLINSTNW